MAFSTSNLVVQAQGNCWMTSGTWSGAVGDADGTLGVQGALVLHAVFNDNSTSGGPIQPVPWSYTASGQVSTVTVANRKAVTNGTFVVWSR